MRVHYQTRIPLIGQSILDRKIVRSNSPLGHALAGTLTKSDFRNLAVQWEKRTRPMTVRKPDRQLGAVWIDSLVSRHRAVSLCDDCKVKYGEAVLRLNYRQRMAKTLTDCDGCGQVLRLCAGFYSGVNAA